LEALNFGELIGIGLRTKQVLYLGEVLLSVGTDLLGSASADVVTDLPVVGTTELSDSLDEPKMLGSSPPADLFPFSIGFGLASVLAAVVSLSEAHLELLLQRFFYLFDIFFRRLFAAVA